MLRRGVLLAFLLATMAAPLYADLEAGAASHERGLGDKALMDGDLKLAMKHYNKAVEMNGADHLNWYKRATALMIDKRYKSALNDLTKSLEIKGGYAQALDKRAKIYLIEGRFGDARADFEVLLAAKPNDPALQKKLQDIKGAEASVQQASHAIARRNWVAARDHLGKALDIASDCVALLMQRAECNMELGDREQALQDTGKALKQDKSNIAALELRGKAYYQMMEFELAQRHFREALRTDPDHQGCKKIYRLIKKMENVVKNAESESKSGKHQDALESYQSGEKIDPDHKIYVARMTMGQCQSHLKLKQYKKAIDACSKTMNLPEHLHDKQLRIQTLLYRAEALQGLEDWEEAVRDCERAVNLDQKDQNARRKLDHAKRLVQKSKLKDWYKVLEVTRDADEKTIKKAYKRKSLEYHPDKVCRNNACAEKADQDRANAKFHEVATAHEILTNPEMKEKYDRGEDPLQENQGGGGHPGGFNPFGGGGGHFTFHFG